MLSPIRFNKTPWHLIFVFIFLSIGLGAAGYFYYKDQKEHMKKHVEEELSAIADLKVNQISSWRKERISVLTMPSRSPFVALGIKEYLRNPSNPALRKKVLNFIAAFKETYNFDTIFLLDDKQKVLLTSPEGKQLDCPHFQKIVAESFLKQQIILTDLHKVEKEGRIHIGAVTPIKDPEEVQSTPIALLVF